VWFSMLYGPQNPIQQHCYKLYKNNYLAIKKQ
jgi:hypothetical protein